MEKEYAPAFPIDSISPISPPSSTLLARLSVDSHTFPHTVTSSFSASGLDKLTISWWEPYSAGLIRWLNPVSVP